MHFYIDEVIRTTKTLRSRHLNNRLSKAEKKASYDVMSPAYAAGLIINVLTHIGFFSEWSNAYVNKLYRESIQSLHAG
jgi:hypothetical protein